MAKNPVAPVESCPVDHATRSAWLKPKHSIATFPGATAEASSASQGNSCNSSQVDQQSTPRPKGIFSRFLSPTTPLPQAEPPSGLSVDREISTIPRAAPSNGPESAKPANSEKESGTHASGNWIYPSEKMFFEAMKRKGYQTDADNMKTIVPIHNAVNERAWKEICAWEKPWGSYEKCGGPKLHSFSGKSESMSLKARFNTLLGYVAPFDRHDWIVDRCGTKVEYIIDFYSGRSDSSNGKLNFYLDTRPKLNSWEGCKMRVARIFGMA